MFQSKAAITSAGILGPFLVFLVAVFNMFGVDISAEVVGLTEAVGKSVDLGIIIIGAVTGIIGRVTAKKQITGVFKPK